MLREFLEVLGYKSVEAEDADSAKTVANSEAESIGVIICDVVLGNVHGPDLIKDLMQWIPEVAVIFTSGYSTKEVIEEEVSSTALFLPKPFTLESLKEALEKAFQLVKID
jgi:DNA-binding NtrC family response regulator